MSEPDLGHLQSEFRAAALLPDAERIIRVRSERWIDHPMAREVLAELQEIVDQPPRGRMLNALLTAEPIDLSRLWLHPGDGGGVLRCDRQHVFMAARDIGVAVALMVLGDPVIAAYLAAKRSVAVAPRCSAPPPEEDDRLLQMAQRILTDPANVVRLAAARTPAARRRLLGRLAREALQAAGPPATSTRAGHARVPGQAAL